MGGTPILNELLEEAANLCLELTERAAAAATAIDGLGEGTVALRNTLANEGDEAHRHFQDLAAKLEAAEAPLETAGQNAARNLDLLGTRAAELQGRVGEMLSQVKASVAALEAQEDTVSGRVDAAEDVAEQGFQDLRQRVLDLQAAADARLQEAATAIETFRQAIEAARQDFAEGQGPLLQAMDQLEAVAWDETQAYVGTVQETLRGAAHDLVDMGNRILDAHNEAVTALRKKVAEEAAQKALEALEPVNEAMTAMSAESERHDQTLLDACTRISDKVQGIAEVIRQVAPVLAKAECLK